MRSACFFGVGGVVSADIAVPDHDREVAFYSKALTTGSAPLWRDDLSNSDGTPVIGLGERVPEYESLPLQWMIHCQVSDVAASAARAVELGGQELMHAKADDGQSQWAVLVDPNGAAFGVMPVVPDESNSSGQLQRSGHIASLSLIAPDVSSISEFYEHVVGWTGAPAAIEGRRDMQRPDGIPVAEIRPPDDDTQGVPSVWLLNLPVGDLAESLRHVREGGGEVVVEASRHAVIRDPVGVYVALQAAH